jgi:type I restriction-modification system DNA methylase subunit
VPAPAAIIELVSRFSEHLDAYKAGNYNETQLRRDFLDPLFRSLGWDMDNEQGYAEAYRDVIHEDKLRIEGAVKAPDYCFRIGGTRKFFLEAKKPAVRIKDEPLPAYQLRRYAWSAKLPLSILSDFEELAVYDCRIKPTLTDAASKARVFFCRFDEYVDRWDWIQSIFSRSAILKGSFDKYADTNKAKRGTAEVDTDFLATIEEWRAALAVNIALRNPKLTQRELNFSVQRTLDRIIFLRICEDRGIEDYKRLWNSTSGSDVYSRVLELFRHADDRYNSGIFHFDQDKSRHEAPDQLTPSIEIDDVLLRKIIKGLYYPESPYEFRALSADILGQVYEQFLGKIVTLDAKHRATVEDKPEVKKAGGVYYTPTYIVEHIVDQTIGPLVKEKSPKQIERLAVIDPACGSGSFLIGAYQYLLDWYFEWYSQNDPEKWAKGKSPALVGGAEGWALTTGERKRILLAHIFGVDIDSQAVEVTKLSLLLKVLEGETAQSVQRELIQQRVLPDLGDNIKCGNSLIGADFYSQPNLPALDDDSRLKINVFGWKDPSGFPHIMKAGGFSAVVGNPPWGANFTDYELQYLRFHYGHVVARTVDSYIYFIAKAVELARKDGHIGFIVPSTLLNQVDAQPARELLLTRGLSSVISLGQGIFGPKVLNTSTIFISGSDETDLSIADLTRLGAAEKKLALNGDHRVSRETWEGQVKAEPQRIFFTGSTSEVVLLQRLQKEHPPLSSVLLDGIARGVSPDIAEAHVLSHAEARKLGIEKDLLRISVSGPQIKRYQPWHSDQVIIYTRRDTPISKYPRARSYLEKFEGSNTCPEVKQRKHPYWSLHRPRDAAIFAAHKFIGLTTSKRIELIYDDADGVYVTDAMYVFRTLAGVNERALMGVMHSRLFLRLYRIANQGESRVIPQIKASKIEPLPIPAALTRSMSTAEQRQHDELVAAVTEILTLNEKRTASKTPHEQVVLDRQIDGVDDRIEKSVCALYGISAAEMLNAAAAPADD